MSAPAAAATSVDSMRTERRLMPPEGVPLRIALADPGERIAAFLTDVIISLLASVAVILGGILVGAAGLSFTMPIVLLLAFAIRNGYFLFFELRWAGATPGKRMMGLRVIDRRGGPLRPGSVVARNLMRQAEFFFPLELLLLSRGWLWSPGQVIADLLWIGAMVAVVLRSRDRMRLGDMAGGTVVVALPHRVLLSDLVRESQAFQFTDAQLEVYGIKELQVLEEVLRRPRNAETARLMEEVRDRIRRRIGWWERNVTAHETEAFLRDFYTAQRALLERRKNLGREKRDKFDRS
jgi:uncharacterized RDD family membrane protein YckC